MPVNIEENEVPPNPTTNVNRVPMIDLVQLAKTFGPKP